MILLLCTLLALADADWDRTRAMLKPVLGDFTSYSLKRVGDQTFDMEAYVSTEGERKTATRMLSDYASYPKWILKNINRKPSGGDYFTKIIDVRPDTAQKRLTVVFEISVAKFKYQSERTFQMHETKLNDRFVLEGTAIPDDSSLVGLAQATMTVFDAENGKGRIWIYLKGKARLRSALLYSLLPENPMKHEAGARVKTAIENYLEWESGSGAGLK
ncbi:MAG: hypothetical protein HYR96_13810 [Deltaproteobacteria bacterium]|nr:hypothetical protein [Deltaproteobacteria bacterium]MBI3296117.1 hypothetical protein [Deltaproteobacteria bacterium]